jgi:hypothetical protein
MASGLIAAANFPGHLAGALLATRTLAGSRHAWLLGSLGAINTGIMGGTTALPAFLLLHLAGGVASALALILSSAPVLRTLADARRQDLAALHFAGVGVGIAISGGPVAALQTMDGVPLLATGAVAVLVPARRLANPVPAKRRGGPSDPQLIQLIGAYGLFEFGYVITATFLGIVRATSSTRGAGDPGCGRPLQLALPLRSGTGSAGFSAY